MQTYRTMVNPNYKHTGIKPFALSSPSSLNQYRYHIMCTAPRGGFIILIIPFSKDNISYEF